MSMYSILFDPEKYDMVDAGTIAAKLVAFLLLLLGLMYGICVFVGVWR